MLLVLRIKFGYGIVLNDLDWNPWLNGDYPSITLQFQSFFSNILVSFPNMNGTWNPVLVLV
jgi:hypothetical protein